MQVPVKYGAGTGSKGEAYVDSLIGRKRVIANTVVTPDEETRDEIDGFLLRGAK